MVQLTQQRVFIVTNYTLTQSVTKQPFICEIVLLASIVAINYLDDNRNTSSVYVQSIQFNSIPIGTITHKNDLYRGNFFGTPCIDNPAGLMIRYGLSVYASINSL